MNTLVFPVLYAIFLWWFLTGAIVYLNGLPKWTFKWSMLAVTALCALSLWGLAWTSEQTSIAAAYGSFTFAIIIWGWQEAAFLLGYATGPRRIACPPKARGWQRFKFAVQAILYHELALLVLGGATLYVCWSQPNPIGLWTFLILWIMRLSAKLNVFMGVRNLNEGILPDHLSYLHSYFKQKAMNRLFPVSILASTTLVIHIWSSHFAVQAPFDAIALSFAGAILTLAILEHWFMVLPLPSAQNSACCV